MAIEGIFFKVKKLFNDFLYEILNDVFTYADAGLDTFKYIAFIGVLIKIIYNLYYSPNDWWGYVSYIPLSIFLFHYDDVVKALFDWSRSLDDKITFLNNFKEAQHLFGVTSIGNTKDVDLQQITFTLFADIIKTAFFEIIAKMVLFLSFLLSLVIFIWLKIKMFFRLSILTLFGPLNISLSFINEFKGNYITWLTKVIEVCMYIPLLYFVDWFGLKMLTKVFSKRVVNNGAELTEVVTGYFLGIVFFGLINLMYFSIPKLVKYGITQGQSAIGTSRKLGAIAMMAARKMATGGI